MRTLIQMPGQMTDAFAGRTLKIHNFDGTAFTGKCRGVFGNQIPATISGVTAAINLTTHIAFDNEPDDAYPLSRIERIEEVKP